MTTYDEVIHFLLKQGFRRWRVVERVQLIYIYLPRELNDVEIMIVKDELYAGIEFRFRKLSWWQCRFKRRQWITKWGSDGRMEKPNVEQVEQD